MRTFKMQKFRLQHLITVLFLFTIVCFVIPASKVEAHSTIEKMLPSSGANLDHAPSKVELWFEDPVIVHSQSVRVTDGKGTQYQKGQPFIDSRDPRHVIVLLDENMPVGSYTVAFNVLAPDGDEIRDRYTFTIQQSASEQGLKLDTAIPEDGQIVKASPKQLEMWFSLPVEISALGVFDDQGKTIQTKEPEIDPNQPGHVLIPFMSDLSSGTYQVTWYAAPKNKPIDERQGIYYFAVNQVTSMTADQSGRNLGLKFVNIIYSQAVAHWLTFIGLLILFGGAWFSTVIAKGTGNQKKWNKVSLWVYGVSVIGFLLLLSLRRLEFSTLPWTEFISLKFVWVPIVQLVFITVGHRLFRKKAQLLFYGLATMLWPYVSGHSSFPRYGGIWSMGIDLLHILSISVWIGGLMALLVMNPKEEDAHWLKEKGKGYSKWALWGMILITATGIGMTLLYLPSFSLQSLWVSDWGKALLIKTVLFIVIIGVGFLQRKSLKNILLKGIGAFERRGKIELLYGVIILFAAALLIESNPVSAEQGIYPKTLTMNGIEATVKITPIQAGPSSVDIHFQHQPEFKQVRVAFYMPPDFRKENRAFALGNGEYRVTGNFLHAAGTMYMEVEAEKMDGTKTVFPFRIVIPGEIRQYES